MTPHLLPPNRGVSAGLGPGVLLRVRPSLPPEDEEEEEDVEAEQAAREEAVLLVRLPRRSLRGWGMSPPAWGAGPAETTSC